MTSATRVPAYSVTRLLFARDLPYSVRVLRTSLMSRNNQEEVLVTQIGLGKIPEI